MWRNTGRAKDTLPRPFCQRGGWARSNPSVAPCWRASMLRATCPPQTGPGRMLGLVPHDEGGCTGRERNHSDDPLVHKLREAELALAQGRTVKDVRRQLEVTAPTHDRRRKEFGGLKVD